MTAPLDALVDALADAVAARVVERIGTRSADASRYYTATDSPLGKRRFLELARRGCFRVFRVDDRGKLLALRAEVEAWIESQARANDARPVADSEGDEFERALANGKLRRIGGAK